MTTVGATIDGTGTLGSLANAGRLAGRRTAVACLVLPLLLVAEACSRGENSASAPSREGAGAPAVTTAPTRSVNPSSTRPESTSTAAPPSSVTSTPDRIASEAPTSTPTPTPTPGSGEAAVTTAEKTTPPSPKRTRKIRYPTGGPRGPVIPPGDTAYEWLAEGKCQKLLDRTASWEEKGVFEVDVLLYRGAASACLFDWKTAIADLAALRERHKDVPDGEPEPVKCDEDDESTCQRCRQIVFQWLSDVVDAHESDPEATLVFTRSSEPSLCPDPETTTSTTEEQPD